MLWNVAKGLRFNKLRSHALLRNDSRWFLLHSLKERLYDLRQEPLKFSKMVQAPFQLLLVEQGNFTLSPDA